MVRCSKCGQEAVTYVRYNGTHLCRHHFIEYVKMRVKREVRNQLSIDSPMVVAVGISGGKDSSVTLALLSEILGERKDVEIHAITVDEGIAGYRSISLEKAKKLAKSLDIEHHIITFLQEYGITLDQIIPQVGGRTPCTYCGVLRRKCLNKMAREIGAGVIATGLNLDDTVQSILMNFTRGDVERLARMGPHVKVQPGLIPRIQPLRTTPEKEAFLYAMLDGIDFWGDACPYADSALRNEYREIVYRMEARSPGSRFSILKSYDSIAQLLRDSYPPAQLRTCACGEPSLGERCKACELLESLGVQTKS